MPRGFEYRAPGFEYRTPGFQYRTPIYSVPFDCIYIRPI